MTGMAYELIISRAGAATLTCGGEVMWTSDGDEDFIVDMDVPIDFDDDEQIDEVLDWLVEREYVPPEVDVEILPEEETLG